MPYQYNAEDYGRKPRVKAFQPQAGKTEKDSQLCYARVMETRLSAHGADHHQYHIVWILKYRKKIWKGGLKKFIETRLFEIHDYHPEVEIEKYRTTREVRLCFAWIKKYILAKGVLVSRIL